MTRGIRLITAAVAWFALLTAAQTALAANLGYHGGPVSHSMNGVIVDWGSNVNAVYKDEAAGDPGLIKYLAANSGSTSDIGGVLAQYLDTTRQNAANSVTYGQQYQISPSVTSTTILDSQIQSELAGQIQAGNLPHPAGTGLGTIYLVLFPSGNTECFDGAQTQCSGSYFCAYHSSTTLQDGTKLLYAVLPDNTSGAMSAGCGAASTLFADQTSYLSHEWSETITDPLGTAWWDSSGDEVADKCNQLMSTQGGWTVQQEWSNLDAACRSAASAYTAPTASFVAPSSASPGQQTSFDAASSSDPAADTAAASFSGTSYTIASGISSYQWNWGDGSSSGTSAQAAATHAYASSGTYQVSLTVTDALGFTSTVTHQIAVSGTAVPVATTGTTTAIGSQGGTLNGTVNAANQTVSYQFVYGTSASSLTQSTPLSTGPSGQTDSPVSAVLSGLSPSTTYYYELDVVSGGQTYAGAVQSFKTTAGAPQTPIVTTGTATQVTSAGALLAGSITPGGPQAVSYHFAYGTSSTNPGKSTPTTTGASGTTASPVSAPVSGLNANTTYYFRLVVSFGSHSYRGAIHSFKTSVVPPAPPQVPTVATGAASQVSPSSARLAGTVTPGGPTAVSYRFSYGTSPTSLTQATARVTGLSGTSPVAVSASAGGLSPSTTYYFRLDVTSGGQAYSGAVASFTTPIPAPSVTTGAAVRVTSTGATISGVVDPNGFATTYHFEYGTSRAYGQSSPSVSAGAGGASVAELFALAGLTPRTTYHFRLVAQNTGGTTVGADNSFTTGSALGRPPRFTFTVHRRSALKSALQGRLKVSFSCDAGCSAHFAVTVAPSGGKRGVPLPLTLARGTGRLAARGSGTVTIKFIPQSSKGLRHSKALKLLVSGYAVGTGTTPSAPQLKPLTLVP